MNSITLISEEDYELRFPNNDKLNIKEMSQNLKTDFLKMYSFYMNLFTKYLTTKTLIKKFDDYLNHSNLNFVKIEEENKDIYQKLSGNTLKYFYVRNNLYLDRLTTEEIMFLKNLIINNSMELDSKTEKFIESTYKKLMFEDIDESSDILTNFGPENIQFFAPSNALIIGFRYDEFNYNGMSDKEWDENYNKQILLLENIFKQLNENIKNNFNNNSYIIKYDDFSIKKKINEDNIFSIK